MLLASNDSNTLKTHSWCEVLALGTYGSGTHGGQTSHVELQSSTPYILTSFHSLLGVGLARVRVQLPQGVLHHHKTKDSLTSTTLESATTPQNEASPNHKTCHKQNLMQTTTLSHALNNPDIGF
jgi:hypothetical protein